jgi:hypothetical protein
MATVLSAAAVSFGVEARKFSAKLGGCSSEVEGDGEDIFLAGQLQKFREHGEAGCLYIERSGFQVCCVFESRIK